MKREEAIKVIKEAMPTLWKETKDAIQTLIPELAENEDERIRKMFIEKVEKWHEKALENNMIEDIKDSADIITYLEKQKEEEGYEAIPVESTLEYRLGFKAGKESEKQKEQKPLTIESAYEKFVNPETLKEARTNKYIKAQLLWELMHNGIITEADYQYLTDDKRKPWTAEEYRIAYQEGFDMSEQLKQKEQKPAEWSREDKEQIAQIERIVKEEGYSKTIQEKIHNWFDSLRPQPKQEWSKEDKEWLSKVYYAIDNSRYSDDEKRGMKKYIKSLRPQPKQEWSEEEERKLQKCIKIVERWEEDHDIAYAPYSGMLKSLRP